MWSRVARRRALCRARHRALGARRGLALLRNVGVVAHIDAGKTTTTERMMLLAGTTSFAGEVDAGNTVLDHLEQERERGITIQAAATTFKWGDATLNLIDTPGHVDFTVEVERAVRVIDGAVLIVDAVAGAQAQTETVWRQARRHAIPAVAFVNKMDREGADLRAAVASLSGRLRLNALLLQLPLLDAAGAFTGVVDLVHRRAMTWDRLRTGARDAAPELREVPLDALRSAPTRADVERARAELIEAVAEVEVEGEVTNLFLEEEEVDSATLDRSIRRLCLAGAAVPTLCGASLHGLGVEPLLDAMVAYLPSPAEARAPEMLPSLPSLPSSLAKVAEGRDGVSGSSSTAATLEETADAVALAFKVVHEPQSRRPLVWLRVYHGELQSGDEVHTSAGGTERITQLLRLHGEATKLEESVAAGDIVAARGLRSTQTGDTLLLRPRVASEKARLAGVAIPPPVFFCSVETDSAAQHEALDAALAAMRLEDPSVAVSVERTTGQLLLGGMGELHLDVLAQRLRSEWKLDVRTGEPQVAYRESLCPSTGTTRHQLSQDARLATGQKVEVEVRLTPCLPEESGAAAWPRGQSGDSEVCLADQVSAVLSKREMQTVLAGAHLAMMNGPLLGFPVSAVRVNIESLTRPKGAGSEAIAGAVADAVGAALERSTPVLLEPLMRVEVEVPEAHIGTVLTEVTGTRRGTVRELVTGEGRRQTLHALVPLQCMVGYSSALRSLTKGEAALSMEFEAYSQTSDRVQQKVLLARRGFV